MSTDKNIFDKKYINISEDSHGNDSYNYMLSSNLSNQLDKPIDIATVTNGKDPDKNTKPIYGLSKPYRKITRGKVTVDKD